MRIDQLARGRMPAWLSFTTLLVLGCPADDDDDDAAEDAADDASSSGTDDGSSGTDESTGDGGSDTAACAEETGDDVPPGEALEIEGDWSDEFMGTHAITSESWTQTTDFGTFTYAIATYDNATDTLVAQDEGDSTWSKFQWAAATGGELWYCQVAFAMPCRADAEAAPAADATDPATGGCGMFPWSRLVPAS